jgi:hypothetical protein
LENLRKGIGDDVLRTRHVVDDPVRYRTQAVFSKQDLVLAASTEIHVLSVDQIVDRCRPLPLIMPLDLEKIASRSLQFAFLNPSTRSSIGAATFAEAKSCLLRAANMAGTAVCPASEYEMPSAGRHPHFMSRICDGADRNLF